MKVLIVDEVHEHLMIELHNNNIEVDYFPEYNYQNTYDIIENYDGLIVRSKFQVNSELIRKGRKLKFLARAGVGLEIFDINFANANNIKVFNAAGANANSVAEHVMGVLLSLLHNINRGHAQVRNFNWKREENRGEELHGKTVGIIGYGNTGMALARKMKNFDCNVLVYDKFKSNYSDQFANESTLEEIFINADILSLHIPLTDETQQMCDAAFFKKFKKNIFFLNSSRGKIVVTNDLLDLINSKKIKGLGLDVLHDEDINNLKKEDENLYSKLFSLNNVIITPHVAGWSKQSYKNISEVLVEKILPLTY